jgi:hypothetical protein
VKTDDLSRGSYGKLGNGILYILILVRLCEGGKRVERSVEWVCGGSGARTSVVGLLSVERLQSSCA